MIASGGGRLRSVATGAGPLSVKERRRLNPSRTTNLLLAVAVRSLPPGHRDRYTREFYAELYGMARPRQLGYALALVAHSTALGLALGELDPTAARTDWRCRVRAHHYVTRYNPDAETPEAAFYRQCLRCGRTNDTYRNPPVWQAAAS